MAVKPVDMEKFYGHIGDIYEAIVVMAKRSRQLHQEMKIELNQRLETIQQLQTTTSETEEEMNGGTNPDQLKISLEFETRPKPTEVAINEVMEEKLEFRYKEPEDQPTMKVDGEE
jgi:DNA-directed RNA polymerase subunit K/omega